MICLYKEENLQFGIIFCLVKMSATPVKRPRTPNAPMKPRVARSRVKLAEMLERMAVGPPPSTPVKILPRRFWTARTNLEKEAFQFEVNFQSEVDSQGATSTPKAKRRKRDASPEDIFA